MRRTIELKHVAPRRHVKDLLEQLSDRLEQKLHHFREDAISLHVVFDVNASHKLYHISMSCHMPSRTIAAYQESHDAGAAIHKAFAEIERQLEKQKSLLRGEHLKRHHVRVMLKRRSKRN